jgi:hypothetical protein
MKNYILNQLNTNQYFLINLDYNSILNYLDEIESEYLIESNKGELIVDQLLVAGNGKNRFISCQFSYGKIELGSAKNIEGTYEYKRITTELLKRHHNDLKYSILTDSQLKMIQEGHVV